MSNKNAERPRGFDLAITCNSSKATTLLSSKHCIEESLLNGLCQGRNVPNVAIEQRVNARTYALFSHFHREALVLGMCGMLIFTERHSLALWPMLPEIPAQNRGEGFLAKPEHWTSQDLLQQCSSMLSRLISVSGCSSSWNSQGSVAMPWRSSGASGKSCIPSCPRCQFQSQPAEHLRSSII